MRAAMRSAVLGATLCLLASPAAAQTGRWLTESGNLEIDIAPCAEKLCGTVARVLANRSMSKPGVEIATPATVGMKILSDFVPSAEGEWEGEIYNRENGKTYSCVMSLRGADELQVRGYVGIHLIGRTQIWHRVPEPTAQNQPQPR